MRFDDSCLNDFIDAGTLLMTEERQKAIWAIYGKELTSEFIYNGKCFLGRLLIWTIDQVDSSLICGRLTARKHCLSLVL